MRIIMTIAGLLAMVFGIGMLTALHEVISLGIFNEGLWYKEKVAYALISATIMSGGWTTLHAAVGGWDAQP